MSNYQLKVATIKHSHHKIKLDHKGKDSHRFFEAGANPSMVTGSNMYGYVQPCVNTPKLDELVRTIDKKADIIIIEGFKNEHVDGMFRFIVTDQTAAKRELVDEADGLIVATITDMACDKPVYQRDDIQGISSWILDRFFPHKTKNCN